MMYIGKKCVKCSLAFADGDDVVACPACGSPHHRSCWKESGKCANAELHAGGFVWDGVGDGFGEEEVTIKSSSGEDIPVNSLPEPLRRYFEQVFDELRRRETAGDTPEGEESGERRLIFGVSENEFCAYTGIIQDSERFLQFRIMSETGRKFNLNIFAGLLLPYYQFYRRERLLGVMLTVLQFLVILPQYAGTFSAMTRMPLQTSANTSYSFLNVINFIMWFAVAGFADYVYARFAVRQIMNARRQFMRAAESGADEAVVDISPDGEYCAHLTSIGKPSFKVMLIDASVTVFALSLLLFFVLRSMNVV